MIGGTKGSHLVVRNKELAVALNGRMLFFEADDYRACIVLSLGGDRLFLGATDLRSDDPEDMECSEDEIDYLFSTMKSILPEVEFTRDDIVYTVAGVRPLPRSDAAETGMISRDHKLHEFAAAEGRPFAVLTLVGGKWTTFRSCAAQIADAVLSHLGLDRIVCTKEVQIGGGRGFPLDNAAQAAWAGKLAERTGIDQQRAELLTCRYGSRAFPIAEAEAAATTQPSLYGYSHAEIGWIAAHERVTRLEDVVQRRTLMAFEGKVSRASLRTVAEIAAPILGWSEEQTAAEIEGAEAVLTNRHRMRLDDG